MATNPPLRLYIDTNIFLDHLLGRDGRSSALFRAIARGDFFGVTSQFTLSEITGVLKMAGRSPDDINHIINNVQAFPNISIVFHNATMLSDMPRDMLATCCQCRDALHFVSAKSLLADRIVTRDGGFRHAVNAQIQCVTPEQLIP